MYSSPTPHNLMIVDCVIKFSGSLTSVCWRLWRNIWHSSAVISLGDTTSQEMWLGEVWLNVLISSEWIPMNLQVCDGMNLVDQEDVMKCLNMNTYSWWLQQLYWYGSLLDDIYCYVQILNTDKSMYVWKRSSNILIKMQIDLSERESMIICGSIIRFLPMFEIH